MLVCYLGLSCYCCLVSFSGQCSFFSSQYLCHTIRGRLWFRTFHLNHWSLEVAEGHLVVFIKSRLWARLTSCTTCRRLMGPTACAEPPLVRLVLLLHFHFTTCLVCVLFCLVFVSGFAWPLFTFALPSVSSSFPPCLLISVPPFGPFLLSPLHPHSLGLFLVTLLTLPLSGDESCRRVASLWRSSLGISWSTRRWADAEVGRLFWADGRSSAQWVGLVHLHFFCSWSAFALWFGFALELMRTVLLEFVSCRFWVDFFFVLRSSLAYSWPISVGRMCLERLETNPTRRVANRLSLGWLWWDLMWCFRCILEGAWTRERLERHFFTWFHDRGCRWSYLRCYILRALLLVDMFPDTLEHWPYVRLVYAYLGSFLHSSCFCVCGLRLVGVRAVRVARVRCRSSSCPSSTSDRLIKAGKTTRTKPRTGDCNMLVPIVWIGAIRWVWLPLDDRHVGHTFRTGSTVPGRQHTTTRNYLSVAKDVGEILEQKHADGGNRKRRDRNTWAAHSCNSSAQGRNDRQPRPRALSPHRSTKNYGQVKTRPNRETSAGRSTKES